MKSFLNWERRQLIGIRGGLVLNDFENFKTILSHGFPSNQNYIVLEDLGDKKYKMIEKKRVSLRGIKEELVYEQFIFQENGEFINWQTSSESHEGITNKTGNGKRTR